MKHSTLLLWTAGLVTSVLSAKDIEEKPLIVEASVGAGYLSYQEDVSIAPVRSEWSAPTGTLRLSATVARSPVDFYGTLRLSESATDTETWKENGILIQENDLTVGMADVQFGLRFPVVEKDTLQVIPRVGGVVRYDAYDRNNFLLLGDNGVAFRGNVEVKETVLSFGPSVGLRLGTTIGDDLALQFDTDVFVALFTEAENDGFDITIEGEGGWAWSSELILLFDLKQPDHHMGISVGAMIQQIDGAPVVREGNLLEWPDNTLEHVSLEIFWMALF